MANINYVGCSYTNPLRVLRTGVMKLESTTDYSLAYRTMTASPSGTSNGAAGHMKLEWRPEGDVAGGRFGVFLADANGANKLYLGEIAYNRRKVDVDAPFGSAVSLTSAKANNRCQVDILHVPGASNLIFDGAATVRLYIVPRDEMGAIVTAAEYSFPE